MGNQARDSLFALAEIIQHLPTMREKVFFLRYIQELPIKTHLHKAHHQLRELLRSYLKNENALWRRRSGTHYHGKIGCHGTGYRVR